jgi:hypothetical protein
MKAYGGVNVYTHVFLTTALVEVRDQLQAPVAIPPGEEPSVPIG